MAKEKEEDYLTYLDKKIRDWLFKPVTKIFGFIPYAANILTIIGFLTLIFAVIDLLYFKNNIERQIWFLIAAWLTDLVDGPVARNNNNITAFGTIADHTRDSLLIFWMVFLSFYITVSLIMYAVLTITALGTLLAILLTRLYLIKKRQERSFQPYYDFMNEFLLNDLKTTFNARLRTFTVAVGMIFYLAGAIWSNFLYFQIGVALLLIQMVFLGFYLRDVFRMSYQK